MLDINRREFIALVAGGCLLLTAKVRCARAQQPTRIPRGRLRHFPPRRGSLAIAPSSRPMMRHSCSAVSCCPPRSCWNALGTVSPHFRLG
jgi:hypothetical protein